MDDVSTCILLDTMLLLEYIAGLCGYKIADTKWGSKDFIKPPWKVLIKHLWAAR